MSDLAAFLLARIDEDEAVARAARPDEHLHIRDRFDLVAGSIDGYARVLANSGRVLAECEAKRRIVEEHASMEIGSLEPATWGKAFEVCHRCAVGDRKIFSPCPTLRLLALPYADHPDFDPAWRGVR